VRVSFLIHLFRAWTTGDEVLFVAYKCLNAEKLLVSIAKASAGRAMIFYFYAYMWFYSSDCYGALLALWGSAIILAIWMTMSIYKKA